MNRFMGGAVRGQDSGRRAQAMVQGRMTQIAAVRTVAGAATLALLALAAISTSGGAQAPRRDSSGWARTPRVVARTLGDTIADRRDERRGEPGDSALLLDAATMASSVRAMADSVTRATPLVPVYRSRSDSIASVRTRLAADRERDLRIVISLHDRQLWALI